MKRKGTYVSLVLVGLIVISSSLAMAQHYCCNSQWSSHADAQWWNYNTPAEYGLTADQISKINQLRKNSNEKILAIENELRSLEIEYLAVNTNADLDVQKLKSLRSSIRVKEEKIEDINLETKAQIKKLLTKEQLTYFNNNQYTWWDMADNCWYSDNMKMNSRKQMMMSSRNHCW